MNIQPNFDVELIFPEYEPHFEVDGMIKKLMNTPRVSCHKAPGNHGFMNELSKNFKIKCFTEHTEYLLKIISHYIKK
ncbi:MAG: hypothetical protein L3J69_12985 [Desulfobacula sp.]|nr:hypothetical protein [Desulfobacula sp.]